MKRAGFSKNSDDLFQIVNYLPASWLSDSFAKSIMDFLAPEPRLDRILPIHTKPLKQGHHGVGCECLGWLVDCMAC